MPEGPSIVILKEETSRFKGKKITKVSGSNAELVERLKGQVIIDLKSWGKHFLICFKDFFIRIHLLMFGSYRIDERKDKKAQLSLKFKNGELNFYTCSIKLTEGSPDDYYDWEIDVMSDTWNPKKAEKAMRNLKDTEIDDALLDQDIFAGVGNIIKNEVLYRVSVHPETKIKSLPVKKLKEVIKEARNYSFDFYEWKKIFQLRDHWMVYRKPKCPRCGSKIIMQYTGKRNRLSFFCTNCQSLFEK
ncbi:MAG: DNA-formamidopyrimidine glycosylase family protein [Bacteroidia bacterium]